MSRRSRACEFPRDVREAIYERDGGCIFCKMGYYPNNEAAPFYSVMHYRSRAHGGLGIEENGAVGCQWHHDMLDNGKDGRRDEMLEIMKDYLKSKYPHWSEDLLIYKKWR